MSRENCGSCQELLDRGVRLPRGVARVECRECGAETCVHLSRKVRLDGTGLCGSCHWRRVRRLSERNEAARARSPLASALRGQKDGEE